MRLSARNQIKGTVTGVTKGTTTDHVVEASDVIIAVD
jgi:molybdopterin-binding protein